MKGYEITFYDKPSKKFIKKQKEIVDGLLKNAKIYLITETDYPKK